MDEIKNEKNIKGSILKYSITTVIGALICVGVMSVRGLFSEGQSQLEKLLAITDGFSVAGMALSLIGLTAWVSGHGVFDPIGFSFKLLINVVLGKKTESYYEYKQTKAAKENPRIGFILIVGLVFLAVGVILTIKYMQLDPIQ